MLVCAGLSPHAAIIIPEVGGDELQKVKNTVVGMREWAAYIAEQEPDVVVFITPHGVVTNRQMVYLRSPELYGDFSNFGAPEISFQAKNDLDLVQQIAAAAEQEDVEVFGVDIDQWYSYLSGSLDHGITVPLYYLREAGVDAALAAFGMCFLPLQKLYEFGQAMGRVLEESPQRICLIASGDLSHRLIPGAPAGYSLRGKEFDLLVKDALEKMDVEKLLNISDDLVEDAGECGLRPIIMLLGALKGCEVDSRIHSYEGPFGVGYMVASFQVTDQAEEQAEKGGTGIAETAHVQLARESLEHYLSTGKLMSTPDPLPRGMKEGAGVFVSLKKDGQLRGCIGTFAPVQENVASEIIHNAVAAGVEDPRFWPVQLEELSDIVFSVDVLTPFEKVDTKDELDPKRYGIIVKSKSGERTGLLLPDLEGVDSVDEQISIASQKAGIFAGEPLDIYRFEVIRYQ
ncbi:MAG: AmmeMemoRadiSam system protein A [Syntrophaceticus sp.]|nr:AmmeMemoRadiSam system protein A [Syntrophaceticus sp.]MDD4360560.1 AmmeMemoRadiSam system protein A [Syntrophaceticus sp.]MDD4783326.1 AmmeMemoRadiSam system protein A [Syntrophaceticus sp.]